MQDAPWTTRFLSPLTSAPPVIVAGDFWHAADAKAYLLAIKNGTVTVQNPPDIPSAVSWPALAAAQTLPSPPTGTILDAAAGDFLGQGRDQLVVITSTRIAVYTAPANTRARGPNLQPRHPHDVDGHHGGRVLHRPQRRRGGALPHQYIRDINEGQLYNDGVGHGPRGKDEIALLRSDGKLGFYPERGRVDALPHQRQHGAGQDPVGRLSPSPR